MSLEWSKLRTWNGSQASAFEELVCQLAFCESVPINSRFIRKGVPDAGVECFWVLPSEDEHGWQAKFFESPPSSSQWGQVDSSVRTALDKHPGLRRYTVAMALDRSDARLDGQTSCLGHWNNHVEKWERWATEKGMNVAFDFWGTHEIAERLSLEEHRGRHFFWFHKDVLSPAWFRDRLAESIAAVGPRYTAQLNVHLPISEVFVGLSRGLAFLQKFEQAYGDVGKALHKASLRDLKREMPQQIEALYQHITEIIELSKSSCVPGVKPIDWATIQLKSKAAISLLSDIQLLVHDLSQKKNEVSSASAREDTRYQGQELYGYARYSMRRIEEHLYTLLYFAESRVARLANMPSLLLVGDAGTGKTHLFSDAASQSVNDGSPAVLLIGGQFRDEEPWAQILQMLGLSCTRDEFLGALEAAAQLAGQRAVIYVDALNESVGRSLWRKYLSSMLTVIQRYPWVALAVSVRSSYEKLIVPDELVPDKMIRAVHDGFADQEYEAAKAFFEYYGIELPAVPILTPEFQNPLFLKLFCIGLQNRCLTKIPTGVSGITSVFNYFLDFVEEKLASPDLLNYDLKSRLVKKATSKIALTALQTNSSLILRDVGKDICDVLLPGRNYDHSLFHHLLSEGILAESIQYDDNGQPEDVIYISYERLSDHLIISELIAPHVNAEHPAKAFCAEKHFNKLFFDASACWQNRGLVEALAIQGPEKMGMEIFELLPDVIETTPVREAFIESLLWRNTDSISDQCLEYVNQYIIVDKHLERQLLDVFLTVAPYPEHPFNADFLHRNLMPFELAERDAWWSIYLFSEYGQKGSVDRLVDWAWSGNEKGHISDESIRLTGKALVWFLTTSHRFLRDRATKALVALFTNRLGALCQLLEEFIEVNDPYVSERLYAVGYGCALRSNDNTSKGRLAETVYKLVFESGTPPCHILLRDYARGVIEVALRDGLAVKGLEMDKIRPPYRSEWPLDIPLEADLEKYGKWSKDMPDEKWALHSIYSSVMSHGDFARYILGSDFKWLHWSRRRLNEPHFPSKKEKYDSFIEALTAPQRDAWQEYLGHRSVFDFSIFLGDTSSEKASEIELTAEPRQEAVDKFMQDFLQTLDEKKASHFHETILPYLDALPSDKDEFALPVSIAQRWILKRVMDLGWTVERFGVFDRYTLGFSNTGRAANKVERIGKKYQWLAYHEFLAHLADNLEFREDTWSQQPDEYVGPWQLWLRNIDPSCLLKSTKRIKWESNTTAWWAPVMFEDWSVEADDTQWLKRRDLLPEISPLPIVTCPETGKEWFVLECAYNWEEPTAPEKDKFDTRRRSIWYMLKSYLVKSDDESSFYDWASEQHFMGRWMPESREQTRVFLGEFFWAPAFEYFNNTYYGRNGWTQGDEGSLPCEVLVPTDMYMQEQGGYDCSIEDTITMYLPAKWIADQMNLSWRGIDGCFFNSKGELVAQDPSVRSSGPSALLVEREIMTAFLKQNKYRLVWTLLGEKDIRDSRSSHDDWLGRMELSACMKMNDEQLEGVATAYWVTRGPDRTELEKWKITR